MNYFGSTSSAPTELEKENAHLARIAAREGFVLLKNDGALPLRNGKIALYGTGARKTVAGGTGSGAVQYRHAVSIEEGLENAGLNITTKSYLDDYDEEFTASYAAWRAEVEDMIRPIQHPMQALLKAMDQVYRYPSGRLITQADIDASDTDTAIYVLMRQAGEGNDRKWEPGDFQLTDVERANLQKVSAAYRHTILIINVGGMIDLSFMDDPTMAGIDGLIFFVQGGIEGGNALADLMIGKENFSGRLADSWPMRYEDLPAGANFSYLNGDLDNEDYTEGIYVGYRFHDSFDIAPRYPFGYGLSYTTFSITPGRAESQGSTITLHVTVTNTAGHAGRQVVQAYLRCPSGKMIREAQSLVAFAKTKCLAPSESEEVTLTFDLSDQAAYDAKNSQWRLEAGNYLLTVGSSSRDTVPAAALYLPAAVITEQCRTCCAPEKPIAEIAASAVQSIPMLEDIPHLTLTAEVFSTLQHDYTEPEVSESPEVKELLDSLSMDEMAELLRGGDLQNTPVNAHNITGASGRSCQTLLDKGIPNVILADGPAGINVVEHVRIQPDGVEKAADIPEKYNWGQAADVMRRMKVAETGVDVYRYATSWPVEELLAQTWDQDIVRNVGEAIGREMKAFGVTLWLAPGMNIHRNPLCGRTFEYFSEDPLLTGKLAAALVNGVQSVSGCGATIKHFCCNNQEDNRNGVSSNINERALREIYLKGFRIAVRESKPWSVMTSYNKLNGVYTANRHDLCTDILRCEWGFGGLIMTDWNSCGNTGNGRPELCAPAGNDLVMPGSDYDRQCILQALEDGTIAPSALRRAAARILTQIIGQQQ